MRNGVFTDDPVAIAVTELAVLSCHVHHLNPGWTLGLLYIYTQYVDYMLEIKTQMTNHWLISFLLLLHEL